MALARPNALPRCYLDVLGNLQLAKAHHVFVQIGVVNDLLQFVFRFCRLKNIFPIPSPQLLITTPRTFAITQHGKDKAADCDHQDIRDCKGPDLLDYVQEQETRMEQHVLP